jgi:tRNA pseudouridine32 synthase/23S rRNA pseudouridine746 synthase
LLLARNPKSQRRFQRAFEAGEVRKSYVAIVDGTPDEESGTIALPLAKVSTAEDGWRMVSAPGGKSAVSHWRMVAAREGRAMILFTPETGRTHQLRVHAAEGLGLPIAGDPRYGKGQGPMLLHALSLRLERPGKQPVDAKAPLPESFILAGFGDVAV